MLPIQNTLVPGQRPQEIKILQFGEGNFLRAFVDWMIDLANERLGLGLGVYVVQPIEQGLVSRLNEQQGLYTLILRGKQAGEVIRETRVIRSVMGGLNPYEDFQGYLGLARDPGLKVVVSNTTEAGIAFSDQDQFADAPPASFPAKVCRLLHERWQAGLGGLIFLPCELIDANGDALRDCVFQYIRLWALPEPFGRWVEDECVFANTLVDRIVTGYPREEAAALWESLGYEDRLLDVGEPFALWVIEGPQAIRHVLPLDKAGLPVVFTPDVTPYKQRKVRMLNGSHTVMVLAAYLYGLDTVGECMADPLIRGYMLHSLEAEIMPFLPLPMDDLRAFAKAIVERFENPFNRHLLLSIALNSCSKFRARVLPSIKAYLAERGTLPPALCFSLASLIAFYRKAERPKDGAYPLQDEAACLALFTACKGESTANITDQVLASQTLWGEDLREIPGLCPLVTRYGEDIDAKGMKTALGELMKEMCP